MTNFSIQAENMAYTNSMYYSLFCKDKDSFPLLSTYKYRFIGDTNLFDNLDFSKYKVISKKVSYDDGIKTEDSYGDDELTYESLDIKNNGELYVALEDGILIYYSHSTREDSLVPLENSDKMLCLCSCYVLYNQNKYPDVNSVKGIIMDTLSGCKQYDRNLFQQPKINLLVSDRNGLDTIEFKVNVPEIDFDLNYNAEFKDIHDNIISNLSKHKGLFILDGEPGTGKTMYIRYLIAYICNKLRKKVIYVPAEMVPALSGPDFVGLLSDNKDSILIIEDADAQIKKRSANERSAVSNILNITDGFLNDCFNIQVILTYNINTQEIDEALLRVGRLLNKYSFSKLSADRATSLSSKLGKNVEYKTPVSLTEVYNNESNGNEKPQRKKIGF